MYFQRDLQKWVKKYRENEMNRIKTKCKDVTDYLDEKLKIAARNGKESIELPVDPLKMECYEGINNFKKIYREKGVSVEKINLTDYVHFSWR